MEYRQLYYFVCIAREKGFSQAAEKIRVSQSSLSRTVQCIEDEYNVQLINRTTRSFKLTPAGRKLLERGERVIKDFEELQEYLRGYSADDVGEIRLGIPSVLNTIMAPLFMPDFNKQYPDVKLYFTVEGSHLIHKEILEGMLDVGLVIRPVDESHFDVREVIADRLVVMVPERHPLVGRKEVGIEELQGESFILLDSTYQLFSNVLTMCHNAGFEPNIIHCSPSWDYIAALVSLSQGISILPRPITPYAGKGVVAIPLRGELAEWNVVAITKKGTKVSANVKNLIKHLVKAYK